ncbi:MAG TPA: TetR/AcrR family transcriptional regulator C-terminal domain-containing protein [Solirubrobacteraceae bacterium]|jgi:AcrR family transcriptional regulator|nr:TetR/AcrR family transcriptional regulator C-terminal domain-containing protein [Solirubrobacteraceae bacterium]
MDDDLLAEWLGHRTRETSPPMPAAPRLRAGAPETDGPDGPTRTPRRGTITREAVVDAAVKVVDADGLDAMTMRRVGLELDTGGASLYAHVAGKEELLELVIDRVIGELRLPGPPEADRWQEQVKDIVRSMRAVLGAHKDIARACLARIPLGPNALRGSEALIGVMRAGGLPEQVIAYACDLLPLYATATAYEESLYAKLGLGQEELGRYIGEVRTYFASLPVDRFPNVVSLAGPLTAGSGGDERFEFGLEVLVRGLAALVPDA